MLAGHVAQGALGPVDLPLGRGDARVLGRVGVAEHDLLHVAARRDDPAVGRVAQQGREQRTGRLELGDGLEQRGEPDPRHGRGVVTAGVDEPGLAGQDHDGEEVVDVVGHRDDVGLHGVAAVGVQGHPDRVEHVEDRGRLGGQVVADRPDQRTPAGHLVGEVGRARCPVEVGVGAVQLADAVDEDREGGVVTLAVLTDVEGGQTQTDRPRRTDQPQDRAVGAEPVAVGQHRVADHRQVDQQLVEVAVVAARLVRRPEANRSRVRWSRTRTNESLSR